MQLAKEISIAVRGGAIISRRWFTLVLIDNAEQRVVKALLLPAHATLTLWSGDEYTAAGDYTQQDAQDRVLEILGDRPELILNAAGKPVPPQPDDPPPESPE
jgi:hypothetical protein